MRKCEPTKINRQLFFQLVSILILIINKVLRINPQQSISNKIFYQYLPLYLTAYLYKYVHKHKWEIRRKTLSARGWNTTDFQTSDFGLVGIPTKSKFLIPPEQITYLHTYRVNQLSIYPIPVLNTFFLSRPSGIEPRASRLCWTCSQY